MRRTTAIMALVAIAEADYVTVPVEPESPVEELSPAQRDQLLKELEEQMKEAARKFEFEKAAQIVNLTLILLKKAVGHVCRFVCSFTEVMPYMALLMCPAFPPLMSV